MVSREYSNNDSAGGYTVCSIGYQPDGTNQSEDTFTHDHCLHATFKFSKPTPGLLNGRRYGLGVYDGYKA